MSKLAAPSGFRDFLPDQHRKRHALLNRIRESYEAFGFEGMDTPAMENRAILSGKGGGENEKLMFSVLKRGAELERALAAGGRDLSDLALRFDLTVPLARYYATHRGALPTVFKRYQIGSVWRAERAQHGRFREFTQCDVDVLGSSSMAVEAEVVLATATALAGLGFDGLRVRLNSRPLLALLVHRLGVPEDAIGAAVVAIDKLDKDAPAVVHDELVHKGIAPDVASAILDFHGGLRSHGDAAILDEVAARVGGAGAAMIDDLRAIMAMTPTLPNASLTFDPFLARGMDYYTGPIFEIGMDGVPFSIAGGGRFDGLIERLAGVKVPACGFSIGFERVFTLMEERQLFGPVRGAADVLIALGAEDAVAQAFQLASALRGDGFRVDCFPHAAKLVQQLEVAERKGIPVAVVVDPARLGSDCEIRTIATRERTMLPQVELAAWLGRHRP
jgi:histidyl-tRNA synthetase